MDKGKLRRDAQSAGFMTERDYLLFALQTTSTFKDAASQVNLSMTGFKKALRRNQIEASSDRSLRIAESA